MFLGFLGVLWVWEFQKSQGCSNDKFQALSVEFKAHSRGFREVSVALQGCSRCLRVVLDDFKHIASIQWKALRNHLEVP